MSGVRFTKHAHQRMKEMNVRPDEALDVMLHFATDYPAPPQYEGGRIACRDDIALAYFTEPDGTKVVATVLPNGKVFTRPEHE